ncbi:MAG: AEC family transporter [Oscillospiraceae bacterium]|nr:AEC family transporter [Oscillospiraceae bacterium]
MCGWGEGSVFVGDALQGMLMLLMLIGVGFFAARRGLLDEGGEQFLSRLALRLSIPALLFVNTTTYVSREFLQSVGWLALLPLAGILLGYAIAQGAARLFRIKPEDRGVFVVMFALSNSIFIGLPVCLAIFGEVAMPYVVTVYPANTLVFWTLGNLGIARDGGKPAGRPREIIRRVFSPPLLGFLIGLPVAISGLALPSFLQTGLTHLGALTVPVSLLTTGAVLSRLGKDALRIGRAGIVALIGRMLIAPGLMLGLCLLAGAPALLTQVFTLVSAMPVMSQCVIMSRLHGANHRLASQMLTLSTLAGMAWIPLWVLALGGLGG